MSREVAAGSPLTGEGTNGGCFGRGLRGDAFGFTGISLEFFEAQFELVDEPTCPLRFRAIFVAAHERVHQFKMSVTSKKVGVDGLHTGGFCLRFERLGLSCLDQLTRRHELGLELQKLKRGIGRGHGRP
ncbi:hypothetical protein NX02_11465 [Sphingomonas sanxanigenens DSM 19645 = NX02]|uniref:Uncharacterized protein n=1 Tax=Sphingomonas sanxanigenens DSM 19645 = NX02 TaxID=1123269 RepID=W0A7X1_9SPHN|nr:hypothetical protein NX02_11360 [Sphingomonas sanxanigenens DSM 19645 = NX02]AHE54004.1 hypothetical protein NX02_11465 [Sphingomonas sanxanigenens DSM 19645 = NX02]